MAVQVRAAFPNIIIPGRHGIQRPRWPFTINRDSPQAEGLAAWWPMMPPGGDIVLDLLDGKHQMTFTDMDPATDWISDVEMYEGINVDEGGNVEHLLNTSLPPQIASDTSGAVELWLRRTSNTPGGTPFYIGDSGTSANLFRIAFGAASDTVQILLKGGTDFYRATISIDLSSNHHLLFAVDSTGNALYLDGVKQTLTYTSGSASSTQWLSSLTGLDKCMLGADHLAGGINPFRGNLYTSAVWSNFRPADGVVASLSQPITRWDRYYELGRVFYSFAAAAVAFVPYPNPRYALTGGMQPMDGGV